ncbi:MAG: stage III sporulation protein AE, partial [Oscillospiraceae bacterium]|nr:stage III sporulation protein AE [Oscillospiraceae bacterium]
MRIVMAAICLILLSIGHACAESAPSVELPTAADIQSQTESLLDTLDLAAWQRVADSMLAPSQRVSVRDTILRVIRGERVLDGATALERIIQTLFQSLRASAGLIIQLIAPALLCAILSRMRAAFENDTVAQACQFVGYALVSLIAARFFLDQLARVRSVVDGIATGMQALFPLL